MSKAKKTTTAKKTKCAACEKHRKENARLRARIGEMQNAATRAGLKFHAR